MVEDTTSKGTGPPEDTWRTGGTSDTKNTRPLKVVTRYPVRTVIYYQLSNRDLRHIGAAQAAAAILAAMGTFALSSYLEFTKDISLFVESGQEIPQFLETVAAIAFWAWVVLWIVAALAYIWQRNEIVQIKEEHGELSVLKRIRIWIWNYVTRKILKP